MYNNGKKITIWSQTRLKLSQISGPGLRPCTHKTYHWVKIYLATSIWPYNPKVMDNQIQPSTLHNVTPNNERGEEDQMLDEQHDQEQQREDELDVVNLLHTHTSNHHTTM